MARLDVHLRPARRRVRRARGRRLSGPAQGVEASVAFSTLHCFRVALLDIWVLRPLEHLFLLLLAAFGPGRQRGALLRVGRPRAACGRPNVQPHLDELSSA